MKEENDKIVEFIIIGLILACVIFIGVSAMGCKTCKPIIQYEEVVIEVPIAVPANPLPVPDNVVCEKPDSEEWRDSALFLKECFDSLLEKIEEYHHIITSYNETRSQ